VDAVLPHYTNVYKPLGALASMHIYDEYELDLTLANNALDNGDHSAVGLSYRRLSKNVLRLEEFDTSKEPHKEWLAEHQEMLSKLEKILSKRTPNRFA